MSKKSRGVNGKQKGASFERKVCKDLSFWLSGGEHPDLLWRSAMSGGRSRVLAKQGVTASNQLGDLSSINRLGEPLTNNFIVECKFYKDLDLHKIITGGKSKLTEFWKQLWFDCKENEKFPMLIAKQNFMPVIVCLDDYGKNILFNVTTNRTNKQKLKTTVYVPRCPEMNIYHYDDLLKCNPKALPHV